MKQLTRVPRPPVASTGHYELFQASQEYFDNFLGESQHDIRPALKFLFYIYVLLAVYAAVFHLIPAKDGFGTSK